jgi:hypothetical protein
MSAILFRVVSGLSIAVAAYAVIAYAGWPVGTVLHPDVRASFAAHSASVLYAHVFGASVALLLGPVQLWHTSAQAGRCCTVGWAASTSAWAW